MCSSWWRQRQGKDGIWDFLLNLVRAVRIGTIHFLRLLIINSCKSLRWVHVISSFLYWYLFISSVGVTKCWWCWSLSRVVGDVEQRSLEVIGDNGKNAWNLVTRREMVLLIAFGHDQTYFLGKFFLKPFKLMNSRNPPWIWGSHAGANVFNFLFI